MILRQTLRPGGDRRRHRHRCGSGRLPDSRSVLFGVSPFDPIAFIGAPLFLLGRGRGEPVAHRRATQVDPMATLRYE